MKVEIIITNDEGKQTAGFMLGEMDLHDVIDFELKVAEVLSNQAKAIRSRLPK
jgi:hypothetical protein